MTAGVRLDGLSLDLATIAAVARETGPGRVPELTDPARTAMSASVAVRNDLLDQGVPIYGVNTGFGDSCFRQIDAARSHELQANLITYHLNGIGPIAADEVSRAAMLIRANTLARGVSGVRPVLVELLLDMLRHGIVPRIPERGSLGASGDLVPLCYLADAMTGHGEVASDPARAGGTDAGDALRAAGLSPVRLEPKEGLALINGTSFTTAFAALAVTDAETLAVAADVCTAMTCEALRGNPSHFGVFPHANKPHPGQVASAAAVRGALAGSGHTVEHHRHARAARVPGDNLVELDRRIQEKYSVRCAPHVVGVLRDTLTWGRQWITTEVNSATDNPLFDASDSSLHLAGNFYAGHVGMAMDGLKVAVASVADLLDRQLALLVDEKFNEGLPANLVATSEDGDARGLHHGFKGMQIACSAVTAEILSMTMPATSFSRSTESHNQDKVSIGTVAARTARTVIELTGRVVAIHLLALAQALELRGVDRCSPAVARVHAAVRARAAFVDRDRRMDGDIEAVADLVFSGDLARLLHEPTGPAAVAANGDRTEYGTEERTSDVAAP